MPTFTAAVNTRELVNGYELSAYLKEATVPKTKDTQDTTTFTATGRQRVGVLRDASWSASGFLDESSAGGAGTVLDRAFADDATEISHYPTGYAAGEIGYGLQTVQTNHEISAPNGGVVEISAEAESNHAAERLVSLRALAASTGGTSTVTDNGASSSDGYAVYLHVTDANAAGTVKVEHSSNNSVYTTLETFTAHSTSPTSERRYATGSVNRYVRVVHTTSGTATFQVGLSRLPVN